MKNNPTLITLIEDYVKYYHSKNCISCGLEMKNNISLWNYVFDDDFSKKEIILKCNNCGIGYTYPFLSKNQLLKLYDKNYAAYTHDDELATNQSNFYKIYVSLEKNVLKFCLSSKNVYLKKLITSFSAYFFQTYPIYNHNENISIKILDYGCGAGHFLDLAKNAGAEVYGVEIDNHLIKYLQKKGIIATKSLSVYQKTNIKFGIIRANQVLEHVKNPKEYLLKFHKLLKNDGELIIGVPNFATPSKIFGKYFFMHLPFHRLHYTKKSISFILKSCNYEVKYIKTKSSGFFTRSLFNSIGIKSSIYTVPIKLFEMFILSFILDIFCIGDCLEVYAVKRRVKF